MLGFVHDFIDIAHNTFHFKAAFGPELRAASRIRCVVR